jgi:hypothetical protein
LIEAARLRQVVDRLRCLAAATAAELEAGHPHRRNVTSATYEIRRHKSATLGGLSDSESG